MKIYTAQYRYSGPDRIDITVRGGAAIADYLGSFLAPTWKMVNDLKAGRTNEMQYTISYYGKVASVLAYDRSAPLDRLRQTGNRWDSLTLVCFCPPGQFCHRILAANLLQDLGFGPYIGERVF